MIDFYLLPPNIIALHSRLEKVVQKILLSLFLVIYSFWSVLQWIVFSMNSFRKFMNSFVIHE